MRGAPLLCSAVLEMAACAPHLFEDPSVAPSEDAEAWLIVCTCMCISVGGWLLMRDSCDKRGRCRMGE